MKEKMNVRLLWIAVPLFLAYFAIGAAPILPMLDWGEHIFMGSLLHYIGQWPADLAKEYCLSSFRPYHIFHYIVSGLSGWLDPTWVSRVMAGLILSFFTGATAFFLFSFRIDLRVLGLAIPLFFGFTYRAGFGPNMLGMPLFLIALAWAERWNQKQRAQEGIWMVVTLLLAWAIHPVPFYLSMCCIAAFFLVAHRKNISLLIRSGLWLVLPGVISVGYLIWVAQNINVGAKSSFYEPNALEKMTYISKLLFGVENKVYSLPIWLFFFSILALCVDAWFEKKHQIADEPKQHTYPLERLAIVAVVAGFFLFVPHFAMGTHYVYQRFLQPLVLVLLLWMPSFSIRRSRLLFVCACGLGTVLLFLNVQTHQGWEKELRPFEKLLKRVPVGSRLMVLAPQFRDQTLKMHVLPKLGHTWSASRAIRSIPSLTVYPNMPIRDCSVRQQQAVNAAHLDALPWNFKSSIHGRFADFLILHGAAQIRLNRKLYPWLFQKGRGGYKLIAHSKRWMLLKRLPTLN